MSFYWQPHEDQALQQMTADGMKLSAISEALGRTKDAIITRRKILSGTRKRKGRPKPQVEQSQRIRQLTQTIDAAMAERKPDWELIDQYISGLEVLQRGQL